MKTVGFVLFILVLPYLPVLAQPLLQSLFPQKLQWSAHDREVVLSNLPAEPREAEGAIGEVRERYYRDGIHRHELEIEWENVT